MALIIFDFDGVLADTLDDLIQFGQEVCDELDVKHVVKKDDLSNLEIMSFTSFGRACEVPENLVDEFVQSCLKRFAEKKSPPAIFNGLSDIVRKFSVNNTLAIVTTNSSQNVNAFLFDLEKDFPLQEQIISTHRIDVKFVNAKTQIEVIP